MSRLAILYAIILFFIYGCREKTLKPAELPREKSLVRANIHLIGQERQLIEKYIQRHGYTMQTTSSGLYYMIYKQGSGKKIAKDDQVILDYTLSLLDGSICYTSDTEGPKTVIVSRSEDESGLHEGLLLLREGDRARLILPPHLGYGVPGDSKKIPIRAILVYDLFVKKVIPAR